MNLARLSFALFCTTAVLGCTPDNEQTVLDAPVANAGADITVNEGENVILNGTASSDNDGTITSYQWQQTTSGNFVIVDSDEATASFTAPNINSDTTYIIRLTVTDNDGFSDTDNVRVRVKNVNSIPAVEAGEDKQVNENANTSFTVIYSDSDGRIETVKWEQLDGNELVLSNTDQDTVNITAPEVSETTTFTLRVTVTDDSGASASDTVQLTVINIPKAGDPPVASATASPSTANAGETVTLDGTGSIDDGSIASYQWCLLPEVTGICSGEFSISGADTDTASFTAPTGLGNKSYSIRLTVTDNDGLSDSTVVNVTVIDDPAAPVVTLDGISFVEFTSGFLTANASGGDTSAPYSYEWTIDQGQNRDPLSSTEDPTFSGQVLNVPATNGEIEVHRDEQYTVTVKVIDAAGKEATASAIVTVTNVLTPNNRYAHNNKCYAMYSIDTTKYVENDGSGGYSATAFEPEDAARFWMRPAALGKYIIYNTEFELLTNTAAPLPPGGLALGKTELDSVADPTAAVFTLKAAGDETVYPDTPAFHIEPTPEAIAAYRSFVDPNTAATEFTVAMGAGTLTIGAAEALALATPTGTAADQFNFEEISASECAEFPEATSNTIGESFKGTTADGHVLGHADVHVHISSTNFLGMTQWGNPYHPLGVTHAMGDCTPFHGETGEQDTVGQLFSGNAGPHDTNGWPTFPLWPARGELTHEAIYWGWLERSWKAGLRVIVTDVVDNETLCELQRPSSPEPDQDCNAMNNIGRQAGSMYGMQDYIDAQYGGRGEGFYQIVHEAAEARLRIEEGKAAVILGIEISNFIDCKVTYNPARTQQPYQETGAGGNENAWACTMSPMQDINATPEQLRALPDNHVDKQLQRLWDLGVRQIVSIHEFDNALGGNGIFDSLVLNAGNRENSGGIPAQGAFNGDPFNENPQDQAGGTGEFWTTYDCPQPGDGTFDGWFAGNGTQMEAPPPESPINCSGISFPLPGAPFPTEAYTGQGGRPGGATPCYPQDANQCNARLMTPLGLYVYKRMMEMGFIIDWDHMEIAMKTQLLELQETQDPPYPVVSTHGTFGGITKDQARRLYRNGGHLFPSLGGANSFASKVRSTKPVWEAAADSEHRVSIFGLGYGTDTNGLSGQAGARHKERQITGEHVLPDSVGQPTEITYPFTLFGTEGVFADYPDLFGNTTGVTFEQPAVKDPRVDDPANDGRDWHIDEHGSAQYGMLADFVHELDIESRKAGPIKHEVYDDGVLQPDPGFSYPPENYSNAIEALFNSAEVYLQTWDKTDAANLGIRNRGGMTFEDYEYILRRAPIPNDDPADYQFDNWYKEGDWDWDDGQGATPVADPSGFFTQ